MANAKKKDNDQEQLSFGADVSRLLEIVAHALYSNREVYLRELISNAADACDRLRYEAISNPDLTKKDTDFQIRVFKNTDTRTVTVADNGIGMTREELVDNLGTIAKSGTANLMKQLEQSTDQTDKLSLIGQFGVGFYASFMVSDRVQVISRKAGSSETLIWESDGKTGFTVREATKDETKQLRSDRGTTIILHINDDASEYLIDQKLKEVIQTYSDHIDFPIYLGAPDDDSDEANKPVNKASALWMRPKNEITEAEYVEFYQYVGYTFDEPITTSHWKAEGVIEFTSLLFTPTLRPQDLYDPTRRHAVRLYVKRVFITDDCEGLMYPWLRFMRGVIDSEDLPLNISREMLQHNPVITKIRSAVAKRILGDLHKLAENDFAAFSTFWGQFGAVLKEGLYDAVQHRDDLLKVTHFYSTKSEDDLTTLEAYKERMPEKQEAIYYISGENLDTLKNSPQLEGFKSRGIEVLFFTDTIDDFWLQSVLEFGGKPFISVTKGNIDLSRFDSEKNDKNKENQKDNKGTDDSKLETLLTFMKEHLKDEVGDIRTSNRMTDSPVCLIADDGEVDLRMERVLRVHQKYQPETKRIMEINPDHKLIKSLGKIAETDGDTDIIADAAHLLIDQARIIQGEPVPDPASFTRRMTAFMDKGLG